MRRRRCGGWSTTMANHTPGPTTGLTRWLLERARDLIAWLLPRLPRILQEAAILAGWIALGQIMFEYQQWTAGLWATLAGPFVEVLVLCWRSMCAAWPHLNEKEPVA